MKKFCHIYLHIVLALILISSGQTNTMHVYDTSYGDESVQNHCASCSELLQENESVRCSGCNAFVHQNTNCRDSQGLCVHCINALSNIPCPPKCIECQGNIQETAYVTCRKCNARGHQACFQSGPMCQVCYTIELTAGEQAVGAAPAAHDQTPSLAAEEIPMSPEAATLHALLTDIDDTTHRECAICRLDDGHDIPHGWLACCGNKQHLCEQCNLKLIEENQPCPYCRNQRQWVIHHPYEEALRNHRNKVKKQKQLLELQASSSLSAADQALFWEAKAGDAQAVHRLIHDDHANPQARTLSGLTPLHFAAGEPGEKYLLVMHILVAKGACVNAWSETSGTPLHVALHNNLAGKADFLLKECLANEVCRISPSPEQDTPLHMAARMIMWPDASAQQKRDFRMYLRRATKLMLERGADRNARNAEGLRPLEIAKENESIITDLLT